MLTNPNGDGDWEKHRLPFLTWLKHGHSAEMMIENIENAITLTDNYQAKWQLSKFLKDIMKRLVGRKHRSRKELGEYLNYRKSLDNDNIAEWALDGIEEPETASTHAEISKIQKIIIPIYCLLLPPMMRRWLRE